MASSIALFSTARRFSLRKKSEKWKHWRLKSQQAGGGGQTTVSCIEQGVYEISGGIRITIVFSENEDDLYFLQRAEMN